MYAMECGKHVAIEVPAATTLDEIWDLITQEKWTITYAKDDVREEGARLKFEEPGTVYPFEGE